MREVGVCWVRRATHIITIVVWFCAGAVASPCLFWLLLLLLLLLLLSWSQVSRCFILPPDTVRHRSTICCCTVVPSAVSVSSVSV